MPAASTPTSPVKEGDVLARKYRVERIIGIGGMGVVVAATHVALHQRVALKFMLPTALGSGEAVERFLREARAVARLRSAHVPRVLDVGTLESGEPYMVMELLEGEDLATRLAAVGHLPAADAIAYVRQACEALVEAHELGIVHRDLKPENLFVALDPRGREQLKVLDFGISKSLAQDPANLSLTRTSTVMGSPLYMSPEQMRASRDVDARTDIWSLGVTLYQLVVGEVPFHAESAMALGAKVLHEQPVPPMIRRPEVPQALNDVILKCLEKEPAERYPDAATLERALAQLSQGGDPTGMTMLASTTGPRVSLGTGGTPSSGSHTMQFSETQLVVDGPVRARTATRVGAIAVTVLAAVGITVAVMRARSSSDAAIVTPPAVVSTTASLPSLPIPSATPPDPSASAFAATSASAPSASAPGAPRPRPKPVAPARQDSPAHPSTPSATAPPPAPPQPPSNPLDHL